MNGSELISTTVPSKMATLPTSLAPLGTLEGIRGLFALWMQPENRQHLIPDVIAEPKVSALLFRSKVNELSRRRNAVLTVVALNNFGVFLANKPWDAGCQEVERYLRREDLSVPPGLDLSDELHTQRFWVNGVIDAMRERAQSWAVQPMHNGDLDFVRWWNQVAAIDTFRALTAGHGSWEKWSRFMIQQGSPIGDGKWIGSAKQALIPTAKGITVQLHAQPDLCELLQFGKADKRSRFGCWTLSFETSRIGSRSGNGYARDTGLKVGHLHLAALMEHLRPQPLHLRQPNLMNPPKPIDTDAARAAAAGAFAQLTNQLAGTGGNSQMPAIRPARRLAPSPRAQAKSPGPGSNLTAPVCWVLTNAELQFQAAPEPSANSPYWASLSLGSICIDPAVLTPEEGIAVVYLHAVLLRRETHQLRLELIDDETEPDRVHLVPTDPLAWPWVHDEAQALASVEQLRHAMSAACWSLVLETDYSRVAHIGLALAVPAA